MAGGAILALGALALWRGEEGRTNLTMACVAVGLLVALGVALIWTRSTLVGAAPIERPGSMVIAGTVLERIEQPADDRVRLVLATREPSGRPIKVRVNSRWRRTSRRCARGRWSSSRRG